MTAQVCNALEKVIRAAGHHTGCLPSVDVATGEPAYTVNAIDAETGESWSVTADDALAAWTELALLVGIELMD